MGAIPLYDASRGSGLELETGGRWALISDQVMGGHSTGQIEVAEIEGRRAVCLTGEVRLEDGGGFVQIASDLKVDASHASHLRALVWGNDEVYGCHLRTPDVVRPWQSYRQTFTAASAWTWLSLPLDHFLPHRLEAPLDRAGVRRIGLVAIGRAFQAKLALARLELV
ncbi:MAG: CIA30 family protein [Myxococcota bacterium]